MSLFPSFFSLFMFCFCYFFIIFYPPLLFWFSLLQKKEIQICLKELHSSRLSTQQPHLPDHTWCSTCPSPSTCAWGAPRPGSAPSPAPSTWGPSCPTPSRPRTLGFWCLRWSPLQRQRQGRTAEQYTSGHPLEKSHNQRQERS